LELSGHALGDGVRTMAKGIVGAGGNRRNRDVPYPCRTRCTAARYPLDAGSGGSISSRTAASPLPDPAPEE